MILLRGHAVTLTFKVAIQILRVYLDIVKLESIDLRSIKDVFYSKTRYLHV